MMMQIDYKWCYNNVNKYYKLFWGLCDRHVRLKLRLLYFLEEWGG